eukprot:scaffold891_cov82-Cylindrotheca_fusiformis.AAC.3
MEPALDVLHRSLHGDAGNQRDRASGTLSSANTLSPNVQLLANMALRVARRSNDLDKYLVATCIENASKYHGSASDSQKLIDINVEIRDIVMGRIAALALDPCFHGLRSMSSFADTAVLEMLCAVLAANAVSNGPAAVQHLLSEWVLPSARAVAEKAMLASHCRDALKCCIIALANRPESLMGNALCLAQANTFLQYAEVLGSMQDSHLFQLAADLALSTFNLCASEFPSKPFSHMPALLKH